MSDLFPIVLLASLICSIVAIVSLVDLKQRTKAAERNIGRLVKSRTEPLSRVSTLERDPGDSYR